LAALASRADSRILATLTASHARTALLFESVARTGRLIKILTILAIAVCAIVLLQHGAVVIEHDIVAVRLPARVVEAVGLRRLHSIVCLPDGRVVHHLLAVTAHGHALLIVRATGHVERVRLSISLIDRLLHLEALDEVVGRWLATCTLSWVVIRSFHLSLVHAAVFRCVARLSGIILERLTSRRNYLG
jgi:hypothetical protein